MLVEAKTNIVKVLAVVDAPDGVAVIKVLSAVVTSAFILLTTVYENVREQVVAGPGTKVLVQAIVFGTVGIPPM